MKTTEGVSVNYWRSTTTT